MSRRRRPVIEDSIVRAVHKQVSISCYLSDMGVSGRDS